MSEKNFLCQQPRTMSIYIRLSSTRSFNTADSPCDPLSTRTGAAKQRAFRSISNPPNEAYTSSLGGVLERSSEILNTLPGVARERLKKQECCA